MTIARASLAALVLAAAAPRAHAQSAEAEVLFRAGRQLIKAGKLAEGCDKLEASARLESSVGTLLNLGDCREQLGQDSTAWATFAKAASTAHVAGDVKREMEAKRREKLLEARLSYLTIVVPAESKVAGLAIARNSAAVDPALWDQDVPVDPGDYDIAGTAPARDRWQTHVHLEAGGAHLRVVVPALALHGAAEPPPRPRPPSSAPTAPPTAPPRAAPPPTTVEPAQPARPGAFTATRDAAIGVAVAGVAGLVVGTFVGLRAGDLEQQSNALCSNSACNNPRAVQLNSDARSDGLYATVALAGGGALVAGAVVLWLVGAPRQAETIAVAPAVSADGFAVTAFGRF